jgi:hypothetical protein
LAQGELRRRFLHVHLDAVTVQMELLAEIEVVQIDGPHVAVVARLEPAAGNEIPTAERSQGA